MLLTGNASLGWNLFSECKDKKKVVLVENGVSNVIGSTSEKVVIDYDKDLLYREQKLQFLDPKRGDRTVCLTLRLSTFEPLLCTDRGQKNVTVTYLENVVEVVADDDVVRRFDLENGVFDLFSVELVLRMLPLEIGYQNEIKMFNHMIGSTVGVNLEVTSLDRVFDGEQELDAFRIPIDIGGLVQTYWISKDTKELLKQSVMLSEGVFFDFIR
ncbi:hypothetical protein [Pseudoneobacillus sp. C159]